MVFSMAKSRILAPWVGKEAKSAIYHCVSRVVERRFHFGAVEKEMFVELMRLYEAFSGVHVLSYCVMSNHFHVLVEVPPRPEENPSDAWLLERVALVQSPASVEMLRVQVAARSGEGVTEEGRLAYEQLRERYFARMWDLGQFMKVLKQRFSRWFNQKHKRKGTLWAGRYNSALVEDGYAARVTAAYIDLNPVRAGMVKDPKDYRWSNYAEAVAGGGLARLGIGRVLERCDDEQSARELRSSMQVSDRYAWRTIAGRYRLSLYGDARAPGESEQAKAMQGAKRSKRRGFSDEQIAREEARLGELSTHELLLSKVRYFVDGAVIGSRGFVDGVIEQLNSQKYWPKQRKAKSSHWQGMSQQGKNPLWSLRRLQRE